jgi:hypothetical protein
MMKMSGIVRFLKYIRDGDIDTIIYKLKLKASGVLDMIDPKPPKDLELGEFTSLDKKQIDELDTLCLFLGPNRNLTTLLGAILFLHPNCQVLSHAGHRVLPNPEFNFLTDYSEEKFYKFCHFAITMSEAGDKGNYGGSMLATHAFRNHPVMRRTYRRRYGRRHWMKDDIRCLVWKEAQETHDYIYDHHIDISALLEQNHKLRFLMPIRSPLDIAVTFWRRKAFLENLFMGMEPPDRVETVLDLILQKLFWAVDLHEQNSEKFFMFFQYEFDEELLVRLAHFLKIEPEKRWIKDALKCYNLKEPYPYEQSLIDHYRERIREQYKNSPDMLNRFMKFVEAYA